MAKNGSKKNGKNGAQVPLKKFTIGFEVEFLIVDKEGKIAHGADEILKKAEEKLGIETNLLTPECSKNIIELGSYPDTEGSNTMKNLLDGLKLLTYVANEAGYAVLPLGTYPGTFTPSMRVNPGYKVQNELFGKSRFQIAGRTAGYHCHYALPWGVFDSKNLMLKDLGDSKNQEYLVSAFNFLIAMDPALTTFMQSSPFYQGKNLAKDSRVLAYRGGEELGYPKGLYAHMPIFGALPSYLHSGTDIISRIEERHGAWQKALTKALPPNRRKPVYRSILDTNWSPVKINSHGTFEERGMDMNRLPILFSVSILMQVLLKSVQEGQFRVRPRDSAKAQPFALEEDGKLLLIPPIVHVQKHLQKLSTYEGLENDEMYYYCKRLVGLAKLVAGENVKPLLEPLSEMLANRKTTSDHILAQAKELGYKDKRKVLPQSIASEIALTHSRKLFKDIVLLEKMIEANEKLA